AVDGSTLDLCAAEIDADAKLGCHWSSIFRLGGADQRLQIIKFVRLQHASVARGERRSPAPGRSRSIVRRHFNSVSRPAKNGARNFEIEPDAQSARAEEGLDRRG